MFLGSLSCTIIFLISSKERCLSLLTIQCFMVFYMIGNWSKEPKGVLSGSRCRQVSFCWPRLLLICVQGQIRVGDSVPSLTATYSRILHFSLLCHLLHLLFLTRILFYLWVNDVVVVTATTCFRRIPLSWWLGLRRWSRIPSIRLANKTRNQNCLRL